MTMRKKVSLNVNDVLESSTLWWYQEGDFVRLVQPQPDRDVILTRAGKLIWQLVIDGNVTSQEIVTKLKDYYSEDRIMANIQMMLDMQIIRVKKNYLWQEE